VLLQRFYHEGLAQASYLLACERARQALIVDPNRQIQQYIEAANSRGLSITHVAETHIHADFLSGALDLARATGAQLLLSGEGGPGWEYAFATSAGARVLRDGDVFEIGSIRVEAVHTPGHTPEHLTFVVSDGKVSSPMGAFTGDFIFVGDVGRPDLLERAAGIEGTMRSGAKLLFESLRRFTEHYPDHLQLWPGHGAGSACGKSLGAVPQTTLGYEKLVNWAFQLDDEGSFVEAVLDGQPDPPPYFAVMKRWNRDGPPPLQRVGEPTLLPGERLSQVLAAGAIVLDIRGSEAFAAAHIAGTINLPFGRSFLSYGAWILPYDNDLYLLAHSQDQANAVVAELAMIGLDNVRGWFHAGLLEANQRSTLRVIEPEEALLELKNGALLLDVRNPTEWQELHPSGATSAPLGRLLSSATHYAKEQPLLLLCATGSRSVIGASLLERAGFKNLASVRGGVAEWERRGLPIEAGQASAPLLRV
jgi:hydroxyacylglutathione hydrolase